MTSCKVKNDIPMAFGSYYHGSSLQVVDFAPKQGGEWYDAQTVEAADGSVQNARSADENLKAALSDVVDAVVPFNHLAKVVDDAIHLGPLGALLFLPMLVLAAIREVLDIVLMPFCLLKNLGDAAVHGIIAATEDEPAAMKPGQCGKSNEQLREERLKRVEDANKEYDAQQQRKEQEAKRNAAGSAHLRLDAPRPAR